MRNMRRLLVICIAMLLAGTAMAGARNVDTAATAGSFRVAQGDGLSLGEAVELVRRKHGGRIVSAETRQRGNREVHVIKVLTDDGKVITETIPGRNRGGRG